MKASATGLSSLRNTMGAKKPVKVTMPPKASALAVTAIPRSTESKPVMEADIAAGRRGGKGRGRPPPGPTAFILTSIYYAS